MSSCQLFVTVLMKFPPPQKVLQRFFRGAQALVLVQLTHTEYGSTVKNLTLTFWPNFFPGFHTYVGTPKNKNKLG